MKKFASLLVSTLFLASSFAWADAREPADLRHCLDLQSNYEIAKCAGELTPGKAGVALPRQDAGKKPAAQSDVVKNEPPQKEVAKPALAKPEVAKPVLAKPEMAKKDADAFRSHVLIVKSHDEIASWVKLEPANRRAGVGHLKSVTRGEKIYFPLIATFSESQAGKKIMLLGELELVTPDGNVKQLKLDGAETCCTANQVDPNAPTTIVLNPVLDIEFDANDLSGKYKLRAKISNGKETVVAEETFDLM
jgi:hypothetical protein